jgi:hypothetical protein
MEDILDPPDEGKDGMNRPFPFCLASPLQEKATSLGEVRIGKWNGNGMVSGHNC